MKAVKVVKGLVLTVILLAVVAIVSVLIFALSDDSTESPKNDEKPVAETEKDIVILDDETLHVTYRGIDNAVGLENAYYLYLTVENKTDTTVIITLADVSVNGEMVTAMSGVPMKITPGNKSSNPFILPCNNTTSVTDIGSIQKISFSIKTYSDDMEMVSETEELIIEP